MAGSPAVLKFPRGLPPTKQFGERMRLLVVEGKDKGTCFSVLGDLIFIGREGCQIQINDDNISRKHAEIAWVNDHYVVRDMGSANGIVHNGKKVPEANLVAGDLVMVGLSVLEVYPPGQATKREKPMLAGVAPVRLAPAPAAATAKPAVDPAKKAVEKKRTLIIAALAVVFAILYLSENTDTNRDHARIQQNDDDGPQEIKGKKVKLKDKELAQALKDYVPDYSVKTPQRKDSDVFFRNGVREMQNKNYRRAFTAFDTALTVDPTHELAKIYLKTAKMQMMAEIENMSTAGFAAMKSLRYKEARMHFENIVRYLEGETGDTRSMENEASKEMKKIYDKAKEALKEIDKAEGNAQ